MRKLAHLTPRYIVDRTELAWWQRRFPEAPWLTATAVALLEQWLRPTDTVFEWGSGRSSAWFARRAGRLVSVEHDRAWFADVGDRLQGLGLAPDRVERHLVETSDDPADPHRDDYVGIIDGVRDATVDLVLVDGLHRDGCARRAVGKVRPGGLLVVDNADWYFANDTRTPANRAGLKRWTDDWAEFQRGVATWRRINTTNGVWDTTIWLRPPPA